jgi:hypothetical protein
MRAAPGSSIALLLILLLVSTTPIGTGAGMHTFDLVHPLFSHVHVVNGRVLTHEQMQQGETGRRATSSGVSLGAANGSAVADGDLGAISTDRPIDSFNVVALWERASIVLPARRPLDRREAPPDPPPTSTTSAA